MTIELERSHLLRTLLCEIVLLRGCILPGSEAPTITYNGNMSISSDGFVLERQVENQEPDADPTRFENVTLYLYSSYESLIRSVQVGTLEHRRNVSVTTEQIPDYVIIWSPEFWEKGNMAVDYYTRTDAGPADYTVDTATSRGELPVEPGS